MTFNPDNLIFFYLTVALLLVGVGLTAYAMSDKRSHSRK